MDPKRLLLKKMTGYKRRTTNWIVRLRFLFLMLVPLANSPAALSQDSVLNQTLSLAPTKFLLIYDLGPELAYQRAVNSTLAWQVKSAYIYARRSSNPAQGVRLGFELKRFLIGNFSKGLYAGFELEGSSKTYSDSVSTDAGSVYKQPDAFDVDVQQASFNFKIGRQHLERRLLLDAFIGVGIRYRHVNYRGMESETLWRAEDSGDMCTSWLCTLPTPDGYMYLHFPLSFRIGYAF